MTLDTAVSKALYLGNGTARQFPLDFKVWDASELLVFVSGKGREVLDVTAQCDIRLTDSGGIVTYPREGAPLPEGCTLSIVRNMPFTQGIDLVSASRFDPQVIEDGLDQATAERQQLLEQLSRAVILPPTSRESPQQVVENVYAARDEAGQSANRADASQAAAATEADRAKSEADRAQSLRDEAGQSANRADASQATAATEADRAKSEADRAQSLRDEAGQSANRADASQATAATEADRAKSEADRAQSLANIGPATPDRLGMVRIGQGIGVDENGVISTKPVTVATTDTPGIVQPDGVTTFVSPDGILSAATLALIWIGVPRYWRSTNLPPNHCWANGDFVEFADWPELQQVYDAGGFEGMLLPWDASNETKAANLGKWRPDAASPTGLYTPNLTDQFLRGWGSGVSRQAGSYQIDQMRVITGSNGLYAVMLNGNTAGCFANGGTWSIGSVSGQNRTHGTAKINTALLGNNYSGDDTHPENVAQPLIIYLGKPA